MPQERTENLERTLSRRDFARLAALAAVATGCSSGAGGPTAPEGAGISITGTSMRVPLSQNAALSRENGMILVPSPRVLVVRVSAVEYRTLSSVCTHQQCTVSSYANSTLTCPCHGSQFGSGGNVVRGPATQALRSFPTTFDQTSGIITVDIA